MPPGNNRVLLSNHQILPGNNQVVSGNNQVLPGNNQVLPGNNRVLPDNTQALPGNNKVQPELAGLHSMLLYIWQLRKLKLDQYSVYYCHIIPGLLYTDSHECNKNEHIFYAFTMKNK